MQTGRNRFISVVLSWLPAVIIALGIILRMVAYIDNRNLWTDEVAVALNIVERSFPELAQPLAYGQYAPPVFLWIVKLCSMMFGFGEQAFRLYPLLAGIASLFVFQSILRNNVSAKAAWYPLLILATGIFYLRYATELKQYMPDALIALLLVWLAQRVDITKTSTLRFVLLWLLAGSVAIWGSMPSVFVLAGVGCYYGLICLQGRDYKKLVPLIIIALVWLLQFLLYYFTILDTQIHSDFLTSYHNRYFLHGIPSGKEEWTHNTDVVNAILKAAFSDHWFALAVNKILLLIGIIVLIARRKANALLFILPILLMLLAAAMKQYSLIPRLTLFAMPLMLLLVGFGLEQLLKTKYLLIKVPVITIVLVAFVMNEPLRVLTEPIQEEQFTEGLDYVQAKGITGAQLYIYTGAANSYRYYTGLHPDKNKWKGIQNARIITEGTSLDSLVAKLPPKAALLYTIPFDSYYTRDLFRNHMPQTDSFSVKGCSVFVYSVEPSLPQP